MKTLIIKDLLCYCKHNWSSHSNLNSFITDIEQPCKIKECNCKDFYLDMSLVK